MIGSLLGPHGQHTKGGVWHAAGQLLWSYLVAYVGASAGTGIFAEDLPPSAAGGGLPTGPLRVTTVAYADV